jgi:hypothetical protein
MQLVSEKFLILRRPEGDMIINVTGVQVKCPNVILVRFVMKLNFLGRFLQNTQI